MCPSGAGAQHARVATDERTTSAVRGGSGLSTRDVERVRGRDAEREIDRRARAEGEHVSDARWRRTRCALTRGEA
jgi:hypothetical protein